MTAIDFMAFQITNIDHVKGFLNTEKRGEAFLSPGNAQARS